MSLSHLSSCCSSIYLIFNNITFAANSLHHSWYRATVSANPFKALGYVMKGYTEFFPNPWMLLERMRAVDATYFADVTYISLIFNNNEFNLYLITNSSAICFLKPFVKRNADYSKIVAFHDSSVKKQSSCIDTDGIS